MLKGIRGSASAGLMAMALFSIPNAVATPTSDEKLTAEGCINIAGGKAVFDLMANYTVSTDTTTGTLSFRDTATGFEFTTTAIGEYTAVDTNIRGFTFGLSSGPYSAVRVFVADNGDSNDQIIFQLFDSGGAVVYEQSGALSTDCGGGVTIVSGGTPTEPPAEPPPGKRHPKGNNGVGNGIDPQPPGNPPINDGPGTGPGNPGNRGGAEPKNRKGKYQ
jgi:hypothetical protein